MSDSTEPTIAKTLDTSTDVSVDANLLAPALSSLSIADVSSNDVGHANDSLIPASASIPQSDDTLLPLAHPHVFAIGDIADTGANKAARPGFAQAEIVARNIARLIR